MRGAYIAVFALLLMISLFVAAVVMIAGNVNAIADEKIEAKQLCGLCGCWRGEDGGVLVLYADRTVYCDGMTGTACGTYCADGERIALDELRPPVWQHGTRFGYVLRGDRLALWNEKEILIFTKEAEEHGEN